MKDTCLSIHISDDTIKQNQEYIGSYFATLELKCIIECQIEKMKSTPNYNNVLKIIRFTRNGFFNENGLASLEDKMRWREVLLLQLLFEKNNTEKEKIIKILNSDYVEKAAGNDFSDKRFNFLRALVYKYIGQTQELHPDSFYIKDWEFLKTNPIDLDLWNTFFKYIIT